MKKILFALSAIALFAFSSCTREEAQLQDNDTIIAVIDAATTRTAIAAAGDHYDINWVENDQITVSNGTATAIYKTVTGGTTVGEFKKTTWGTFSGDSFTGYYPSELIDGFLPYRQEYAAGDVYKVPMISDPSSDAKTLLFKPVTGILKINLTTAANNVVVKDIVVKADQGFSGSFSLVDGAAIVNGTDGTMLDCGTGVAISSTPTPFYIAAPANTYSNLEITVVSKNGMVSVAKLQEGTTYTVRRGEIREIDIPANTFAKGTEGGVATLCYGSEFNEYVKQLVTPKKFSNANDSVITKISFLTNDYTVGQVKVSDAHSDYPIYATLEGTLLKVTTPASSIKTGKHGAYLFSGMTKLKVIENLNVIDFSENEDFSYMFNNCYALESIDLSNFVTDKSMTFAYMFCYCQMLRKLDLSTFRTGNALSLAFMFQHCESLTALDVRHFDVSNCRSLDNTFDDCWVLKSLDLSTWNTDKVRDTRSMFNRCKAIKELDISHMTFPSTTRMNYMFYQMEKLEVLHIEGMDFSRWTDAANQIYMFNYIPNLKEIYFGEKCYNEPTYRPEYIFCANTQAKGTRTASRSETLTIHCTQQGADWLSQTNLRWINSGYNGKAAIPVTFLDCKTGAELSVTWAAN